MTDPEVNTYTVSFIVAAKIVEREIKAVSAIAANDHAALEAKDLGALRFVMPVVFSTPKGRSYTRYAVFPREAPRRHLGTLWPTRDAAEMWAMTHG